MSYTADEENKTITIMRVIYARRNYEDILCKEDAITVRPYEAFVLKTR